MMNLSDLPASSAKLETMHWELGGVSLQLPATAVFPSLVDLSLENIEVSPDSGHLLARLLSSACCPSLQKLQLRKLTLPKRYELRTLGAINVRQDNYRALDAETEDAYTLWISAPRLEELTFLIDQPRHIVVDGELPCMERLKIDLFSNRDVFEFKDEYDINKGSICLLHCCTSLTCLEVSLKVTEVCIQSTYYDMAPNSLKTVSSKSFIYTFLFF